MLKGLDTKKISEQWFVYILECKDGTFYTGITNNINRRIAAHNAGKGARYTRSRGPVTLRYQESCANRSTALIRECAVKTLTRDAKEKLFSL